MCQAGQVSGYYGVAMQIKDYDDDDITPIALGNSNMSRTRSIMKQWSTKLD